MKNFRDFEFRGDPNVYINREIQEVPVFALVYHNNRHLKWVKDLTFCPFNYILTFLIEKNTCPSKFFINQPFLKIC